MTIKHPRLTHAILALRPGVDPMFGFRVQDDGEGPYLVDGSMDDPPTQAEVDALTTEELDAAQIEKNERNALYVLLRGNK